MCVCVHACVRVRVCVCVRTLSMRTHVRVRACVRMHTCICVHTPAHTHMPRARSASEVLWCAAVGALCVLPAAMCAQHIPGAEVLGAQLKGPKSFAVWHYKPYTSRLGSVTRVHYKLLHTCT